MYLAGQHGVLLCCPVFSLPFNDLLVLVLFQFPDEVPNNLDFLPAVAAGLVRRMDNNIFTNSPAIVGVSSVIPIYLRMTAAKDKVHGTIPPYCFCTSRSGNNPAPASCSCPWKSAVCFRSRCSRASRRTTFAAGLA